MHQNFFGHFESEQAAYAALQSEMKKKRAYWWLLTCVGYIALGLFLKDGVVEGSHWLFIALGTFLIGFQVRADISNNNLLMHLIDLDYCRKIWHR